MTAKKNKKDWSLVVWLFGWLMSFVMAIRKIATKLKMPFEAFERLASDRGEETLERVMRMILEDWRADGSREAFPEILPPDQYRIRVDRGPFPPISVLEEKLGREVSEMYDGHHEWVRHTSRQGADALLDGEIVVYVHDFGPDAPTMTGEDVTIWALWHGYVPLDEHETLAFALDSQTQDLRQKHSFISFGSYVIIGGGWVVPTLENDPTEPAIKGGWFGSCVDRTDKHLFRRVK